MASAKDSLNYMQKKMEVEIQNKLSNNNRSLEEAKIQMRSLKDVNEMMNEQLDKTLNYQQNKIDEARKRTDEVNAKLYEYATKNKQCKI